MDWSKYEHLAFEYPSDGVLVIRINRPERKNAMNKQLHTEFTQVWHDVANDTDCRAVIVTGQGEAFSAGGDFDMVEDTIGNYQTVKRLFQEAADVVYNITNCPKPVISAINGVAVGAGLAVALMADISLMAENARLTDGHVKIGVAAGDHAAIIWPLLCGLAKARYYLLTCEFIDGREAERIGLVSKAVPAEDLLPTALKIAERLASGSADAISATKRTLNHWVRQAGPIFESSLAMEMLGFFSPDAREGLDAMLEKRRPAFPSSQPIVASHG
ncbi:enoyl-CoA hydratase/isomerase family protein [Rhodococcus wratislaviensis]|uniref:Putative enoyl-CoA hydratase n=1 Tax=Rhodococcus wratislaviensis NBRC 100605 TaxID=1219028 RepID=X0PW80_RHOWR|nr:enoyl-CoA hydratase/isomerase family protein [Rhodococcus wratislaviensis]GAF47594.1 putative enoyl-CoA hydratase [Rhodococcus wratislaviensis NBRC 100605]